MNRSVSVRRVLLNQMLDHARRNPYLECCGLLAGRAGKIFTVFPAQNALASATAYQIAPQELFTIFREIRAQDLELLGIYHSHPQTENAPSATDIARAYYPEAIHFIISPKPDAPKPIRAFRIRDDEVIELVVQEVL